MNDHENKTVERFAQERIIKTYGPNTITIRNELKIIATIHPNGDVTLDGDPNEAANIFWKYLKEAFKTDLTIAQLQIEKLKEENTRFRESLKSISETYISGDSVYSGAENMKDAAREALKDVK
jgi:ubiquitin C-terminal hydrolase